jgi:hypothetical protein
MPPLTSHEMNVVGRCLACIADGDVIGDDWEFETLFGISFSDFHAIARSWPDVELDDDKVTLAIGNGLNNLLGYPHGRVEIWDSRIGASPFEVKEILARLHATWI